MLGIMLSIDRMMSSLLSITQGMDKQTFVETSKGEEKLQLQSAAAVIL